MTATILAAALGCAVCAALWASAGGALQADALSRTNYRGRRVYTGAGVLLAVTMVLVWAAVGLWERSVPGRVVEAAALAYPATLLAVGFGLLGFFDDAVGAGQSGGFRGHLRDLARGRVSSGALKMLGGVALSVVVAALIDAGIVDILRDGAVLALAANAANLFDRAPGRATKVAGVAALAAALVARDPVVASPAVGIGAAVGLLRPELTERIMLGDAGANPLGALTGLAWLVAVRSDTGRWVLLGVVLALNVASEVVSFSKVIEAVPPLRWFDSLGRLRATPG